MKEEALDATLAAIIMSALAGIVSYYRLAGAPFFDLVFEVSLFYFPLALLLIYVGYLWKKDQGNGGANAKVNPPLKGQ